MNLPDSSQLLVTLADQINLLGLHIDLGNLTTSSPDHYSALGWIVWLPVIGAILNGIWGKRIGRQGVYITGIAAVGASFLLSLFAFYTLLKTGHAAEGAGEAAGEAHRALSFVPTLFDKPWDWFLAPTGPNTAEMIRMRYVLDPLSGVMLLVVTGVGTLIHVYSAGYMSHDPGYARFFAYLNLFIFAMLNLILGDSMVLLFLGWEGVGLASYLLIGFWYQNQNFASAGRKAFIVNRIGDAGLILGMSILAWKGGTYQFETLRAHVTANDALWHGLIERTGLGSFLVDALPLVGSIPALATRLSAFDPTWGGVACMLLFVGCCGKSAQFPLYVWLPDAMAGPTPVSALIHAATMVTAGVYLLCRLSFLFLHFTSVLNVIALVGAFTALFAATIAVTQVELKKVLAYSTVSQLGFMFMGCGVGAFSAGFFHVFTHAFFKACLFLGAGAVMHACGDRQDLRDLGGLRKYLPTTFLTMGVATLAIIGTPLTSGFFSKDEILFRAYAHAWSPGVGKVVYFTGLAAATLTAFYMCRMFILTFFGEGPAYFEKTGAHAGHDHAHADDEPADAHGHGHTNDPPSEAGLDMKLMTYPLIVLAALALLTGVLGLPFSWVHQEGYLARFLEPAVGDSFAVIAESARHRLHGYELVTMIGGILAWAVGTGAAYWVYVVRKGEPADRAAETMPVLYRLVSDKWRVDELYDLLFVRPLRAFANFVALFDRFFIDGVVNLVGWVALLLGRAIRPLQTGAVQVYGAFIGLGALVIVAWVVGAPSVAITQRYEGTNAVLEAAGGPGYTYRWAFYDPDVRTSVDTLDARCPAAVATTALSHAGDASAETHRTEALTGPRCVILEARNAFGRSTSTRSLLVPTTVIVPGNN